MRRAAAHAKPIEYQRMALPKILDEFAIFSDIDRIMQKLEHGEIEHANGRPIFLSATGEWCEVVPALNGWISVWKRYDQQFALQHDLSPLVRVCNKLNFNSPLTPAQVQAAKDTISAQRKLFKRLNRDEIASAARTEQTAILLEDIRDKKTAA